MGVDQKTKESFKNFIMPGEELLAHTRKFCEAVEILMKDGDQDALVPVLFVTSKQWPEDPQLVSVILIPDEFDDHEDKHRSMFKIGKMFEEKQQVPTSVFMAAEAWLSTDKKLHDAGLRPAQDPNRREIISIQSMSLAKTMSRCLAHAEIVRVGENIQPIKFGEIHLQNPEDVNAKLLETFYAGFFDEALKRRQRKRAEKN